MELNENEVMVISTAFVDMSQGVAVLGMLSASDFSHPLTGGIFSALQHLITQRLPVDELSICQTISSASHDVSDEFLSAVKDLLRSGQHTDDIGYYAKHIRNAALSRRLARCGREISTLGNENRDAVEAVTKAQDMVLGLSRLYADGNDLEDTSKALEEVMTEMMERKKNPSLITGVPSGFTELDERYTSGWQRGDLIILAARPSMGKTAFMVNCAQHVCIDRGRPVYIFSLEMSKKQLLLRLLASMAKVPSTLIRNGQVPAERMSDLQKAARQIDAAPLFINDSPGMNVGVMQMLLQKAILEFGEIDLICVDYLQLMESKGKKDSRNEEVSSISRGLKQIARQSNAPLMALSQLSRAVEARENKKPQLSDLRDSGSIEQDADAVLFLYRDEYYKKDKSEKPGVGEIIVSKQRNGPVGEVELYWNSALTQYLNKPKRIL